MAGESASGGTGSPLTVGSAAETLLGFLSDSEDSEIREEAQGEATPPATGDDEVEQDEEYQPDPDNAQVEGDEAEDPEVEPQQPQTHRVKVDGEELDVTLDELIKGYSRTADYTRKTQTLAEQRKAAEAEATAIRAQRDQYETLLTQMDEALKGLVPQEPNWEALQRDYPEQFPTMWAKWQQHQSHLQTIAAEKARIAGEKQVEQTREYKEYLQREHDLTLETIPEWKDQKARKSDLDRIVTTARALGFSDQEVAGVADHRALRMMRLAAIGMESLQKRAQVQPQVERIKAAKPGAQQAPRSGKLATQKRALDNLAKTGSLDAAAGAFLTMIPD